MPGSLPQLVSQPQEDHFSGVIGGRGEWAVAGPAGREPTSALGTPPWPTDSFCQSRIHFILGFTHHESRIS